MKLIGVDYGRRRIGIAVTDAQGRGAVRGLCVIDRKKNPDLLSELLRIIGDENPAAIVMGLPLGDKDQETTMSAEVRAFASEVEQRSKLPIHFVDESFTSQKAAELIMFRKKKERRDKGLADRIAACLILQAYLDINSI
ncbi:MAG: Holliday junction resolvase RuvX [Chitinispirillales bacterium]|jgi:putative Holliday junction resolvase|nr:Holliday junction resolvase RuvX [Chitinispirillales bacterium]